MGKLEDDARRGRKKRYLQQAILTATAVTGMLAVAMIAPNIFQAVPRVMGNKYKFGYRARTAAGRLAQKGHVRFVERNGKKYIEITEAGRHVLAFEEQRAALHTRTKKRWDGRWRMVVFDIPERKSSLRVRLRRTMQAFGFLRLQDSVWVFPYDCEDLMALLKADLRLGKDVLYAVVETIENDSVIRKHFNLR